MKISAVVVLYNPGLEVVDNIKTFCYLVNHTYIVDNSTLDISDIIDDLKKEDRVSYIKMDGNEGIAKALNVGLKLSMESNFDFCLTMDQDSVFPTDKYLNIIKYLSIDNIDDYGIIGLNFNSTDNRELLIECDMWLTSGNFINLKNYRLIDGFKSDLFIDYVDINLNEQFNNINKKIAYINEISLKHTIGNPIKINFLGIKFTCSNHSVIRYYYRFRNGLYLYKRNKKYYRKKYYHDILIDIPKIIFFEPNKIQKIKMILRGRKDAKNNVLGKMEEK